MNITETITNDAIRLIKEASSRTGIPAIHIQGFKVDNLPGISTEDRLFSRTLRNNIIKELSKMGHKTDIIGSVFGRSQNTIQAILRK